MPARPFCKIALRSRSRFLRCRSAAFSLLCRWLGDSFSRERFAEDIGMVGRVFWGAEGCNAGSMDTVGKSIYCEWPGGDQPRGQLMIRTITDTVLFGSFSD
jgi:hypothetical protein